jgi:hypothetical protein
MFNKKGIEFTLKTIIIFVLGFLFMLIGIIFIRNITNLFGN